MFEVYEKSMKSESNFVNGVPELLLLRLLEKEEMYGYQLVAAIRERSRDMLSFGEGCVYPLLHGLEGKGLISKRAEVIRGRQRFYYRVTPKGRLRLEALTGDWKRVSAGLNLILGGSHVLA